MNHEIACPAVSGAVNVSIQSIPFSQIPGQSALFTTYNENPAKLTQFYPSILASHTQTADRVAEVLANHTANRNALCDALEEINRKFGATEKTLENIEILRQADAVAVVTGQQAGLFSGPLYTIYKALTAIKAAECLRGRGIKAVPVFWIATEDHDFDEVSKTYLLDRSGTIAEFSNEPKRCHDSLPVGYIKLDETIDESIAQMFDAIPHTEFSPLLRELIEECWSPHTYFGDAFGKLLTRLLGKYGLIALCPLDPRLKELASPIYVDAIRKSGQIVEALQKRSQSLTSAGFGAQVHIEKDYFPLFWQDRDGTRNSLRKNDSGDFETRDGSREFTLDELIETAERDPARFSPSVVLRSVVQDYLLPTVCYFGGGAEISYFAQNSEVYRILNRPFTPILHRQSFTVIESRHAKTMDRYHLDFLHLFEGIEGLLPRLVGEYLNAGTAGLIADVEERINTELNRLDQNLSTVDPTLADNLAKRRRKILYHISAIRGRFQQVQFRRDAEVHRRVETLFNTLLPKSHLQERSINVLHFLNRYGLNFTDWIYEAIDLDDKGHRLLYI